MSASTLTSEESSELLELRRRAYGTPEGIGGDLVAQSRLEHLEGIARPGQSSAQPASDTEITTDAAAVDASAASGPAVLIAEPPATTPSRSGARFALVAVAAALVGATVAASVVAAIFSQPPAASTGPSPSATIGALPPIALNAPVTAATLRADPGLTVDALQGAATWAANAGLDLDTLQGYRQVGSIIPWTATMADGSQDCILLQVNQGAVSSRMACAAVTGAPAVGLVMTSEFRARGNELPAGTVLLFLDAGDTVELRVSPP